MNFSTVFKKSITGKEHSLFDFLGIFCHNLHITALTDFLTRLRSLDVELCLLCLLFLSVCQFTACKVNAPEL